MKTCAFHLGDYRRAVVGPGKDVPDDYFFVNGECDGAEKLISESQYHIIHQYCGITRLTTI